MAVSKGTLFLDEVGDLPLDVQVMLLRVVEERQVRPVGSNHLQPVDVRIIAATNKDLEREVAQGLFRQDLFYRLDMLRIDLPALRERREDIPLLAERFLSEYCADTGKAVRGFNPEALARLQAHDWPGNVRELRTEVRKAAVNTQPGDPVAPAALSPALQAAPGQPQPGAEGGEGRLKGAVEALERRMIADALARFEENLSSVADHLGLSRPGLRLKMERYGIARKGGK